SRLFLIPLLFFFLLIRPPPSSTLFPYTTLFRSRRFPFSERSPGDGLLRSLYCPHPPTEMKSSIFPVSRSFTKRASWPTIASKNRDRKSTRLNSSHVAISYAVFCLKKKKKIKKIT